MLDDPGAHSSPADQADFYAENGYLIVEGLLNGAELEADLVKLARGEYDAPDIKAPAGNEAADALERILCIHMPHFVSPVVRRFTVHPGIAEVLGRIVGAHLRAGLWSDGLPIHRDAASRARPTR